MPNAGWEESVRALPYSRVVIVIAPRGYGSTAFSLRLLACHAAESVHLIRLEADWKSPKLDKLPLQKDCAYQLDLQDPDHDRFDGAFLSGLGKQSADLKALGSYLILAVADELWSSHRGQVPAGVTVVRLDNPPDALELVERHLKARGLVSLVPYIRQADAAKHVQGRNAVQASRAVDDVVRQWQEHRHKQNTKPDILAVTAAASEPQDQTSALDSDLQKAIEQALGNWEADLDDLFGEPGPPKMPSG